MPSILPDGYRRVEYIENPIRRGAYIRTNINNTSITGFEIDAITYNALATTGYGGFFGGRWSSGANSGIMYGTYPAKDGGQLKLGTVTYDPHFIPGERFVASLKDGIYTINGDEYEYSDWGDGIESPVKMYIFGISNSGSFTQQCWGRIYALRFTQSDAVVANYIPCINPLGEVGLYDTVNLSFHKSYTSTPFVAGPIAPDDRSPAINTNFLIEQHNYQNEIIASANDEPGLIEYFYKAGICHNKTHITRQEAEAKTDFFGLTSSAQVASTVLSGTGVKDASCFFYFKNIPATTGVTGVFRSCGSVQIICLPKHLTQLQSDAFRSCTSIKVIIHGPNITSIATRSGAYQFATNQQPIMIYLSVSPPSLNASAYYAPSTVKPQIYVPDASVDTYKAASNWSTLATYIHPLSEVPNEYKKYIRWYE